MRLIEVSTITLHEFVGQDIPRYAILSHTWGEGELLFEDLNQGTPKRGLQKVLDTCKQAELDNIEYVWVDTCCIDRSSSAELSEAINSMFKYYNKSAACYVFMEDVTLSQGGPVDNMINFDTSRWFTRGWTLQELIAPHELHFFDCNWRKMQSRHDLAERLSNITGIHKDILSRRHRLERNESIATKMKWAANRVTTREEDIAYCLLGLFDINMPLLYGEGRNAFIRLQEEILRRAPDQTILTWTESFLRRGRQIAYLPEHPSAFHPRAPFLQGRSYSQTRLPYRSKSH
ncbi:heterokaryon incompatibility protein-domain-containing protein [Dactylonectria estremocensis]|uniref:Heterokaryon incompatibility protein-domain-containing protein n=1 Tax=Dactylonectria estremocensis TaxID=1079267 RepID=A0A9P9DYD5_9HYPO|nr:heterokaryon incompatibility protein-domain-containing protein [Dactylonectria estremocensis]